MLNRVERVGGERSISSSFSSPTGGDNNLSSQASSPLPTPSF